jgi:MBG domain (YGX type)/WD40-like Beta Propeller Repeat
MEKSKPRSLRAWKLVFSVVSAACALGAIAASLSAAAPSYTGWSAPVNLGPVVNTSVTELGPAISADGLSLYFFSGRPGGFGGNDIWVSQRPTTGSAWGAAVNAGPGINTAAAEIVASLSADGHWMFFASDRLGGYGGVDLYQSYRPDIHDDFGWQPATNVGANVNTAADENGNGSFDNGGVLQLFFGSSKPGGLGGADIYVSNRQTDGSWGPASAVSELNSSGADNRPNIRLDGLEIFFYSDRPGTFGASDLWVASRTTVAAPWSTPVNLGPTVNTSASEQHPSLSADGRTLYFGSNRAGGSGGADLMTTTRAAILVVTANNQSRLFGQTNPSLTYTISGFVGGDTSAVVSGSAACSTTATASSPAGTYPITCTVGTLSAPGYIFATFVPGTLTVSYSRPCLSGVHAGPLNVAAGEAVCIASGGMQVGPVRVSSGGSLDVEGGQVTGPITASGAVVVRICGATITGPLTISGSTGPVLVGGAACEADTIVGPVRVTDNTGGVEVNGNHVIGLLRVTGNSAPVHALGNMVTGPVTIQP